MECSGSSLCGYGGLFPIGCSSAAICRLKIIQTRKDSPCASDMPTSLFGRGPWRGFDGPDGKHGLERRPRLDKIT